ncbi:MAG: archease [Thiotrichales bacterium]|nr:MAG: archease [Thiotrichales bacterium]
MNAARWEHFEHKADIGIRGYGNTLAEAFEQAAIAMTTVVTDLSLIHAVTPIHIRCADRDHDTLFYDWINALIYEMATRKMLFSQFNVEIDQERLSATATGEAIDIEQHQPSVEIKGATFTELGVYQEDGLWVAQCVIDV